MADANLVLEFAFSVKEIIENKSCCTDSEHNCVKHTRFQSEIKIEIGGECVGVHNCWIIC